MMNDDKNNDYGLPNTKFEPINLDQFKNKKKSTKIYKILIFCSIFLLLVFGGVVVYNRLKKRSSKSVKFEDEVSQIEQKDSNSIFNDEENEPQEDVTVDTENQESNQITNENAIDTPSVDSFEENNNNDSTTSIDTPEENKEQNSLETATNDTIRTNEEESNISVDEVNQNITPLSTKKKGDIVKIYEQNQVYYVVICSFIDSDLADKYAEKLSKTGQNVLIILPRQKEIFYKVAIAKADDYQSATEMKNRIKENAQLLYSFQAWVLKY